MGKIKEAIRESVKEIDTMYADATKRNDTVMLAELRIMKWNMMRALYATIRLERILSTAKQNTKQKTK